MANKLSFSQNLPVGKLLLDVDNSINSNMINRNKDSVMTSVFVEMKPMIYVSGFAFPLENIQNFFQNISYTIPLPYFIIILIGVVSNGIDIPSLWMEALILFGMGALLLVISSMRVSNKIE